MLSFDKDTFPRNFEEHRVLVVDQLPIIRSVLEDILISITDIRTYYCTDSKNLVDDITSFKPTVILLGQINEEIIDYSTIEALQKNSSTVEIPIVVMSTVEKPEDKTKSFKSGASDFIVKFPDVPELVARIRYHSQAYIKGVQRDDAYCALRVSQQQLLDTNLTLQRLMNDLERSNKALKILASLDGLTGIANRATFDIYISEHWNDADTHSTEISLLMIDVDHFKKYNDSFGHVEGDETLKRVAAVISSLIFDKEHLAARYGGEEFCLVLPKTSASEAWLIANDLLQRIQCLAIPHNYPSEGSIVTLSIGIASMIPENSDSPTGLVMKADESLYRAKNSGRNRAISNT